jgi:hypothetical protein
MRFNKARFLNVWEALSEEAVVQYSTRSLLELMIPWYFLTLLSEVSDAARN